MKKIVLIALIAVAVLGAAVVAVAAKPKPKSVPLSPVTVAVEGLHCKACVDELQKDLAKLPGVSALSITRQPGQATAKLDESKTSAGAFVTAIATHAQLMDRTKTYGAKLVLYIDTAMCAQDKTMCEACFTEIPKVLKAVNGVSDVALDDTGKIATVTLAKDAAVTTKTLANALAKSPFKFTVAFTRPQQPQAASSQQHQHTGGGSCH